MFMDALIMKYLLDEVSHEEEKSLLAWIAKHPDNAKKFDESKKLLFFPGRGNMGFTPDLDNAWVSLKAKIEGATPQETKNNYKFKGNIRMELLKMTAAIALLAGIAYGFGYFTKNQTPDIIANTGAAQDAGEKLIEIKSDGALKFIYLPDSSMVFLNKNSKLSYSKNFNAQERIVYLEGESFFDVKRNPDQPFLVYAGMTKTRALGTSFNIKAYEQQERVEVTVASGKVVLFIEGTSKDRMMVLERDDKAVFTKSDISVKKKKNDDRNYISWIEENDGKSSPALYGMMEEHTLNNKNLKKYNSEVAHPASYLNNVTKWMNTFSWDNHLIKEILIEGEIYNSATIAVFKDIILKVNFYDKKHSIVDTQHFTVRESVAPGEVITYKRKLNGWHEETNNVIVEIEDASVEDNELKLE